MKSYLEKYGIERVKDNLRYGKRYFKTSSDYANTGITVFNNKLFLKDINLPNFPIALTDQNGWNLPKAPTAKEFEVIYNYLKL